MLGSKRSNFRRKKGERTQTLMEILKWPTGMA